MVFPLLVYCLVGEIDGNVLCTLQKVWSENGKDREERVYSVGVVCPCMPVCMHMCVCLCVCVRERERQRQRDNVSVGRFNREA